MPQPFDDDDFQPLPLRREAELTLGAGVLTALAVSLLLVCGLCFWLGYRVGHGAVQTAAVPAPSSSLPAKVDSGHPKPSATSAAAPSVPRQGSISQNVAAETPPNLAQPPAPSREPVIPPAPSPVAHPMLPAQPAPAPPAQSSAAPMVQIAAVSHREDADVLVNALRKRGYSVTVSPDADTLLHVRIGPFGSRQEANQWKQRLLNDGYNAIVQP
jgi:cell division septation protein DedD